MSEGILHHVQAIISIMSGGFIPAGGALFWGVVLAIIGSFITLIILKNFGKEDKFLSFGVLFFALPIFVILGTIIGFLIDRFIANEKQEPYSVTQLGGSLLLIVIAQIILLARY